MQIHLEQSLQLPVSLSTATADKVGLNLGQAMWSCWLDRLDIKYQMKAIEIKNKYLQ